MINYIVINNTLRFKRFSIIITFNSSPILLLPDSSDSDNNSVLTTHYNVSLYSNKEELERKEQFIIDRLNKTNSIILCEYIEEVNEELKGYVEFNKYLWSDEERSEFTTVNTHKAGNINKINRTNCRKLKTILHKPFILHLFLIQ